MCSVNCKVTCTCFSTFIFASRTTRWSENHLQQLTRHVCSKNYERWGTLGNMCIQRPCAFLLLTLLFFICGSFVFVSLLYCKFYSVNRSVWAGGREGERWGDGKCLIVRARGRPEPEKAFLLWWASLCSWFPVGIRLIVTVWSNLGPDSR